jgi:6-phosphogluconolactonase/glucosamine-6-phosphate isomerase/deaminase
VMANYVPKFKTWRLTFTYPLIFAAHEICFLVDSNKSASLIERVFGGDESLPSTLVDRDAKRVTWILGKSELK